MKKVLFSLIVTFCLILCTSCDQVFTRNCGGTTIIKLEPGEKLVSATWKDADIWYLVEPMDSDYVPKSKTFKESSPVHMMEGKVIFIETK